MKNNSSGVYNELKSVSISGVKWSGIAELLTRFFQFGVTIILARILTPVDFGLITLALIIVLLMQLVIDFGLSSALIQRKEVSEEHFSTSFYILLLFSVVSSGLVFFSANSIADILGNLNSVELIEVLSFAILLSGLAVIPRVVLMRHLDFRKIAIAETISKFIYSSVTVIAVLILRNLWCFIIGIYSELLVLLIMLWAYSHWKPRLQFSLKSMKDIVSFSSVVFGTRSLNFANVNILNVLINRFYGSTALGSFSLAYQIVDLPTQRIAKTIMKVMYPILSKLQDEIRDFQNLFLNYMFILVFITLPIYLTLFLAAEPFILTFFGEKWIASISILKLLCLLGFLRCLWTGISVVSMSLNKPKFEFYLNIVMSGLLIPGFFIFSSKGLNFLLIYFVSILFLLTTFGYFTIIQWLKIPFSTFSLKYKVPAIAGISTVVGIFLVHQLHFGDYFKNNMLNLTVISILSLGLYSVSVILFDRKIFKVIFKMVLGK